MDGLFLSQNILCYDIFMTKFFTRSKIFLFVMVAFIAGIFLGGLTGQISTMFLLISFFVAALCLILPIPRISKILIILIISIFLGIYRYQSYLPKIDKNHVGFYVDNKETYLITGVVDAEPAESDSSLKLQISNNKLQTNDKSQNSNYKQVEGKILVTIPKYYEVNYGDSIQFKTKLAAPSNFETFDYSDYLARYGVYAIAKGVDNFEVVNRNCQGAVYCIQRALYQVKDYFSLIIQKIYPEPHGSFMLGILIGAKASLPDWLLNIFQIIGITHIIAISGYNITILAKVAEKTLGKIGRKYIFWGVLMMIVSFVIMTGAQASIVRAGIMGGLLVYAGFIGRRSNAANLLILAGAVMIFLNPLILKNDVGFQLSFLATLGLVYISPVFELWFKKIPEFFRVMLSATLSAQVLTLPIIVSSFGRLSLIAPVANVIILGFIPLSMFLGFTSGIIGMLWLPLGKIVGFFGFIILDVILKISELLARVPYASLELKVNNWIGWGAYYLVIGALILIWYRRKSESQINQIKQSAQKGISEIR